VPVLRWICLGAALQVITWPWGFIIMAKGRQTAFLAIEIAYAAATLAMTWPLVHALGVEGAGVAFFASYVLHGVLVYPTVRRLTGFRCSDRTARMAALYLGLIGAVFCGFRWLPPALAAAFGAAALVASTAYSARALFRLVAPERLPRPLQRLLGWARALGLAR
jgi:PST family polysaccharide transporter